MPCTESCNLEKLSSSRSSRAQELQSPFCSWLSPHKRNIAPDDKPLLPLTNMERRSFVGVVALVARRLSVMGDAGAAPAHRAAILPVAIRPAATLTMGKKGPPAHALAALPPSAGGLQPRAHLSSIIQPGRQKAWTVFSVVHFNKTCSCCSSA